MQVKELPEDRFWRHVNKTETCWLWIGAISNGYGAFRIANKNIKAHRYSYEIQIGIIPKDLNVLHKCDVRNCVNTEHLFLGTQKDNVQDCINKKRRVNVRGEKHPGVKLTEQQVKEIRTLYKLDLHTQRQIAKQFNINYKLVHKIVNRKIWKHI
jgi:hypothetical protein